MARQTRFRPYAALPSEQKRLQRLREFINWLYHQEYPSPEWFFADFERVQLDLGIGGWGGWGTVRLLAYVQKQDVTWCQRLHRQIREAAEKLFERGPTRELPAYPRYLGYSENIQNKELEVFLDFGHKLGEEPRLETVRDLILLRLADTLLYGLNIDVVIPCQECGHYTVRSHARGKTFCSAKCRVKAFIRKRVMESHKPARKKSVKRKEG